MTPFQPENMRENTWPRLVFPQGIFSCWNDVIRVSITAQRHESNVLYLLIDDNDYHYPTIYVCMLSSFGGYSSITMRSVCSVWSKNICSKGFFLV